jgi:PadR family transcriptional regulator PadR
VAWACRTVWPPGEPLVIFEFVFYSVLVDPVRLSRVTAATLDVLEALMGRDDELYAYRIALRAGRKTRVIYPILDRLEEAGWIESRWEREEPGQPGPRRRFYQLSPGGLSGARALLTERRGAVRQRGDASGVPARRRQPIAPLLDAWGKR